MNTEFSELFAESIGIAQNVSTPPEYIDDFELRAMAIVYSVLLQDALQSAPTEEHYEISEHYVSLVANMDHTLLKRFNGYLSDTMDKGTDKAEWRNPAERIRKIFLPK